MGDRSLNNIYICPTESEGSLNESMIEDVEDLSTSTSVRNYKHISKQLYVSFSSERHITDHTGIDWGSSQIYSSSRKSTSPSTTDRTDMGVLQKRNQNLNNPKVIAAGQREPVTKKGSRCHTPAGTATFVR